MSFRSRQFLAAACGVSIAALCGVTSRAEEPFAVPEAAGATVQANAPNPGLLSRLPVGPDSLVLTGEHDRRDIPFYVTPQQTAGTARLVLWLQSAISVMPEASELTVFVNNVNVGQARLGSASRTPIEAELPPGLLQPGFNALTVIASQVHRVDCSKAGTYELWTRIDPSDSGFVFGDVGSSIYDLAALGNGLRGADGQLVIRGHVPATARLSRAADTLEVLQSMVVAGRISDFKAEISEAGTTGPGLDLLVGTTGELASRGLDARRAVETEIPGIKIAPPDRDGRAALIVTGYTEQDLRDNVRALAQAARSMRFNGTGAGIAAADNTTGRSLEGDQTVKLSDLGYVSTQFRGRYYRDQVAFRLPADFYPADYDKAFLTLDAAYAPGLLPASELIVKANGRTVSTISLSGSQGGVLKRQRLPISLAGLRPGENVLSLEAELPSQSDLTCDPAALANGGPRLTVSPDSTITLPRLARVGHSPDLAATMAGLSDLGSTDKAINLFVPGLRPQSLDAAATLLGRMAYSSGKVYAIRLSSVAPNDGTGEMIAVGQYSSIPSDLLTYVGIAQPGVDVGGLPADHPASAASDGWLAAQAATTSDLLSLTQAGDAETSQPGALAEFAEPVDVGARLAEMSEAVRDFAVRLFARVTGSDNGAADIPYLAPTDAMSVVMAQRAAPLGAGAAWTVIAAPNDTTMAESLRKLGRPGNWTQLQGAIAAVPADGSSISTIAAADERLFETQPRSIGNARLVLAGWFSHNTDRYVVGMFSTFILLGFATHLLARRVGRRNR